MELLETQSPERRKLLETSERHKREFEKEVRGVSDKTEKAITNALIIGGSLALTYFVVSQLTKSKKTKVKRGKVKAANLTEDEELEGESQLAPSLVTQIGEKLVSQASIILLDLAKEKLSEYLTKRKNENS
jgi:hypothetical protein